MDHPIQDPEPWIVRFVPLIAAGGRVLDLACGAGRHTRLLLGRGHPVTALDRDVSRLADLAAHAGLEVIAADVESGPWPLAGRRFAGITVVNYHHRPLLPVLADSLGPGGVLIYQTFATGNERFGRPRNPDFLLRPGELLQSYAGILTVVAYEYGEVRTPRPAVVQRICAVSGAAIPPLPL